jgi:hypothetical protein
MSSYLGDFRTGNTVRWTWGTNAAAGGSITRATNGTVSVYKDGGTTQSTAGVTDTEDFDSLTGVHLLAINTSADGTFYSAGSDFSVVLSAATIDGQTVNSPLCQFSIENRSALMPTTADRKLDVSATGEAGIDLANVGSPTATLNLSGTTISTGQTVAAVTLATSQPNYAPAKAGDAMTLTSAYDAAKTALTSLGATAPAGWLNAAAFVDACLTLAKFGSDVSLADADIQAVVTAALTAQGYTTARAAYLANLNVGGPVASSAEATAIQNNTRVVRVVPDVIERPDSGATTYRVELLLYDDTGNMEAPDAAPTIALVNSAGTDRSSRLDSITMALVSTGRYRSVYTAAVADALEQLVWTFSVVEGGATRIYGNSSLVVDTAAVDFTAADRTKLEAIHGKLPSKSYLTGSANLDGDVQLDEATGTPANSAGVATLLSRIPSTPAVPGDAMTLTSAYDAAKTALPVSSYTAPATPSDLSALATSAEVQEGIKALARKDASIPNWLGGTFNPATDSLEAADEAGEAGDQAIVVLQADVDDLEIAVAGVASDVDGLVAAVGGVVVDLGAMTTAVGAIPTTQQTTGLALGANGLDDVMVALETNVCQAINLLLATATGKISGALPSSTGGTRTIVIMDADEPLVERVRATTDANGNRTALTLTKST